ncbi:MAG: hypothetical protein HGA85_07900 [Nanoarchaeota archaeon]|nr:hypothetical protein [Nanoarchaeota archaeon]
MNISGLRNGQKIDFIEATISDIGVVREFSRFGKPGKVAACLLKDDTGSIEISLWDDQIELFSNGDRVRIENAFVKDFRGVLQVALGRLGTIEKINKD